MPGTFSTTSVKPRPNKAKEAIAFVERHGVVLQAARGPVPSLAEAIAGETIRGSWWGHAKGREIFRASRVVCESPEVLVCKFVDNKVTYALIKLAPRFGNERLAKVWEEHAKTGARLSRQIPFPEWVPADIMKEAERLSTSEAERILSAVLPEKSRKAGRRRTETRRRSLQSSPCQGQPKAQAPGQRRT
jgi:hypothetical protein